MDHGQRVSRYCIRLSLFVNAFVGSIYRVSILVNMQVVTFSSITIGQHVSFFVISSQRQFFFFFYMYRLGQCAGHYFMTSNRWSMCESLLNNSITIGQRVIRSLLYKEPPFVNARAIIPRVLVVLSSFTIGQRLWLPNSKGSYTISHLFSSDNE